MEERIYDNGDLVIISRDTQLYLRYDAGAHQITIREDEISKDEARRVMSSEDEATKVLFEIQKRLKEQGKKPYVSNVGAKEL